MSAVLYIVLAALAAVGAALAYRWLRRPVWRVVLYPALPAVADVIDGDPFEPSVDWSPTFGERLIGHVRASSRDAAVRGVEKRRRELVASGAWEKAVYAKKVAHYAKSGPFALADWLSRGSP